MLKLYDRGADRGKFRFCVVDRAESYSKGDEVRVRYHGAEFEATILGAGRPYGRPLVRNYYVDLDPSRVGAPDVLTAEQEAYRAMARTRPLDEEETRKRKEFGARMSAARARRREARRDSLRSAIDAAGGREAFAAKEGVTLAWIRRSLGEKTE